MMKNKKGFEFSFAWFFAILVGAIILFMAIYSVTKVIDVGRIESDVKVGQQMNVLLNPLETGFESGVVTSFSVPANTRIYNDCDLYGNFGSQKISISQKSFNQWSRPQLSGTFFNKYIFSEEVLEEQDFYLFSKSFEPLFKVNDYIYIIPFEKQYCFVGAPEGIEEEVRLLNKSFMINENCPESSIKVCFNQAGCDIYVNMKAKTIEKNSTVVRFMGDDEENGMIFAGIFSDAEVYECQVARMMKRLGILNDIYKEKAQLVSKTGCETNVNFNLIDSVTQNYENSNDLGQVESIIEKIERSYGGYCGLW